MLSLLRAFFKALLSGAFYYSGLFHLLRAFNNRAGRRLTIVAYHRVRKGALSDVTAALPTLFVTEESFVKQLEFMKKHFTIITFSDLKGYAVPRDIPANALIVTFDDGYEDNYTNAYPVLLAMDVRAAMFLVTDKTGEADETPFWWDLAYFYFKTLGRWYVEGMSPDLDPTIKELAREFAASPSKMFARLDREDTGQIHGLLRSIGTVYNVSDETVRRDNPILRWSQVREMRRCIEFGSHSVRHLNLTTLDDTALAAELVNSSREIASHTGQPVHAFSYPGGNHSARVREAALRTGYDCAVTTEVGINDTADRFALKRITVWEGTSRGVGGRFSKSLFAFKLLAN